MPTDIFSNFGHYARLMIALAVIAYNDPISSIPADVEPLGVQVVWGPAEIGDGLGVSYTRAFITRDTASEGVYTVVIRGTNPLSLLSWTLEDFDVGTAVRFNTIVPTAPESALISQGTYYGLAYLAELRDSTGRTMMDFLHQARPDTLFVTGHSLGGTLVPPTFAYLHSWLSSNDSTVTMAPFSFAGLTPGNAAFNTYFNGLFDPGLQWRVYNTLDIAPYMWWSLDGLQNVYSANQLSWGWPESAWLTHKFRQAAPIGYAQPAGGWAMQGTFDSTRVADDLWVAQAAYQHHGCTYFGLVSAVAPSDTAGPSRNFQGVCPPAQASR